MLINKILEVVSKEMFMTASSKKNITEGLTEIIQKGKCKNCEVIENGSIIKLDGKGKCLFCGRQVGGNYQPLINKEELEALLEVNSLNK